MKCESTNLSLSWWLCSLCELNVRQRRCSLFRTAFSLAAWNHKTKDINNTTLQLCFVCKLRTEPWRRYWSCCCCIILQPFSKVIEKKWQSISFGGTSRSESRFKESHITRSCCDVTGIRRWCMASAHCSWINLLHQSACSHRRMSETLLKHKSFICKCWAP